ncbi:DNA topoisomerase, partial [Escherichia coli]
GNIERLTPEERNIYDLIVRTYLAQFYPVHEYKATTIIIDVNGETFGAGGRVTTKNGWKDVYSDGEDEDEENESEQSLPSMKNGDEIICAQAQRQDAKTKAPRRFNDGT